jgi:hypothetical protein
MNNISFFKALLMKELNEKDLPGNQEKIAQAAKPKNKITGADFAALRAKKDVKKEGEDYAFDIAKKLKDEDNMDEDAVYIYLVDEMGLSNMAAQSIVNKLFPQDNLKNEGEDHEVSMAQNSLKSIISSASQLMNMLGQDEKDIPAWIQDHITNAENFINQASKNYHEYHNGEHDIDELPDGTIEKPTGDAEDLDMTLQSMMEAKSISLKDFSKNLELYKKEDITKSQLITSYNKLNAKDQDKAKELAKDLDVLPTPKKINETSLKSMMENVLSEYEVHYYMDGGKCYKKDDEGNKQEVNASECKRRGIREAKKAK